MLKLPSAEYTQRRQQLLAQLPVGAVVLIQAAASQIRNGDVEQDYRQNSNFQYLCGFLESDAVLVLSNHATGPVSSVFCRSKDK